MKKLPMILLLGCITGCAIHHEPVADNTLTSAERKAGWKLLFDGKTTAGWRSYGGAPISPIWTAHDGMLVDDGTHTGDVVNDQIFDNFELTLDWKLPRLGNGGVFYRSEDAKTKTAVECQIIDNAVPEIHSPMQHCCSAYGIYPAPADLNPAPEQWHHLRILADGPHCEHWLDGAKVVEYDQNSADFQKRAAAWHHPPNFGTFFSGHIALQGHGTKAEFKNIKLRRLNKQAQP